MSGKHADHQIDLSVYLNSRDAGSDALRKSTALIILNTPIDDLRYLQGLYDHTALCLCADGGANRLHDLLITARTHLPANEALNSALPQLIHGDLDSLRDDVRDSYKKLDVEILEDPDQYSTDLGKGVKKVVERLPSVKNILILGSLAGRVDQGIGVLHELYREQKYRHPGIRFWFFSESSVSVLLSPGTSILATPLDQGLLEPNVGILPLYGAATISTGGLEWDVSDWPTQMGGQVSTSNHIKADQVVITTDVDVLFTVERKTTP